MSIGRHDIPFTYEHYKALTASSDQRYELIDGELYMAPAPSVIHQVVSKNLTFLLEQHVRATHCGRVLNAPLDVVLGDGENRSVVQPDVMFISNDRAGVVGASEVVAAPDLLIEVLSPGTAARDRGLKKALYACNRVQEYWIVDPDLESIEVFSLGARGYRPPLRYCLGDRLVSAVVPNLTMSVDEAFRML